MIMGAQLKTQVKHKIKTMAPEYLRTLLVLNLGLDIVNGVR